MGHPLFEILGKEVIVEVDGLKVEGRLIKFQKSSSFDHRPEVLFLKRPEGIIIVHSYQVIKVCQASCPKSKQ